MYYNNNLYYIGPIQYVKLQLLILFLQSLFYIENISKLYDFILVN